MVVGDQDPDRHVGTCTVMRVPPCGSPSTLKRPPMAWARSLIVTRPKPVRGWLAACGRRPTPSSTTDIRNSDPALPIEITTLVACACLATLLRASCAIRKSATRSEEHTSELQSHLNLVC